MKKSKIFNAITLIFIALAIGSFVYSLGFFTNFLQIRGADRSLYDLLQLYNRKIFNYALGGMLISFLLIVSGFNKGNRSLITKIIACINGLFGLWISYFFLQYVGLFKTKYLAIDVEAVRMYYPDYVINPLTFDIGMVLYIVMILASLMLITITWLKPKGGN